MREEKKKKRGRVPFFSSIQMKYAMSYLAIVSVVLILLNTYPVLASQDLLFGSKRDSLKSQAAVMASALMELELLTSDQVERVMTMLDSSGPDPGSGHRPRRADSVRQYPAQGEAWGDSGDRPGPGGAGRTPVPLCPLSGGGAGPWGE